MVRCHTNLLPMNSHWQQDYTQGKPLWVELCPLCCINARTPLAKCSGRKGGKAREAGRGERAVGQPSCEAVKVEGRGGRHGLQACLGQPTVAGLAQAERAHALRERTLDPLALSIELTAGFALQASPSGRQRFVFGARP